MPAATPDPDPALAGLPTTLSVGGIATSALRERLDAAGVRLNPLAERLFADARFTTEARPRSNDLVATRVADLGFGEGATWPALMAAAAARGWVPGPLSLAPHLRLAYTTQPEGAAGQPPTAHRAPPGALTVVSMPLPDDDEAPWGFYLRRIDGVLWLRGYRSWPGHCWSPEDRLLFCRDEARG